MASSLLKWYLWRCQRDRYTPRASGFTLIELLVAMLIAGIIITTLLYAVVELMGSNQRESARTETQREMQLGLDYIASELREAAYVYSGECLEGGVGDVSVDPNTSCPGLVPNHIPLPDGTSEPILAMWKLEELPEAVRNLCTNNLAAAEASGANCLSGKMYTLVVYFLSTENATNKWDGEARIIRYALRPFDSGGNATGGYLSPDVTESFQTWPFGRDSNNDVVNLQPALPDAGIGAPLVDFVSIADPMTPDCPNDYDLSPNDTSPQTFYACVRPADTGSGLNQDTIVHLKGNAKGKPGVTKDGFLPSLSSQVLSRGVVDKNPF